MILPSSKNKISSAWTMVDNRWAIIIVVVPLDIFIRFSWIAFSVWESREEVASSKRKIRGRFSAARAIATLCFSPPESLRPRSPTRDS